MTIPARFDATVARTPDAIAVSYGDVQLTYECLAARAALLAEQLTARGVGPERTVAILLDRSLDVIVSILAVLRAGGAYVPLDPAYPAERLAFMLADVAPACLIGLRRDAAAVPAGCEFVAFDAPSMVAELGAAGATRTRPGRRPLPANAAYVIYTSGSTGLPKGTIVTHGNVLRLFDTSQPIFAFGAHDVWTLFHSPAFDFSVWEIWGALFYGGRLVVVPHGVSRNPAELLDLLAREQVTVLNQTPSAFYALARVEGELSQHRRISALRYVVFGGEALDLRRIAAWYAQQPADGRVPQLVNMYGITETTVHVTWLALDAALARSRSESLVGTPLPDLCVHLLDDDLQPVPTGVDGDIYVGGPGVARGYLRRSALTATRFVANPYGPAGSRLYRSGDLARRRPDGTLAFIGRTDEQVKIRGFRVEPGEIEAALREQPGLGDAVVIAREDRPDDKRLVAYVTLLAGAALDAAALRSALALRLPDFMVPAAFVALERFPLTANGKLDRRALPSPTREASRGRRLPRTPIEQILVELFADVLGVPSVAIDDDFFKLGGHSLLATRLASRVRESFGIDLPVRTVFDAPTVEGLARHMSAGRVRPALRAGARPPRPPLSYAQQRLWFLDRLTSRGTYHVPVATRLRGALDRDALAAALSDIVDRHEALRTIFPDVDGVPYQHVLGTAAAVSVIESVTSEPALPEQLAAAAMEPIDLATDLPIRAHLFTLGGDDHVLLLVLHHIAADGWSVGPLWRDLSLAYTARRQGRAPAWSRLAVQYADYALWQRELLGDPADPDSAIARELGHWRTALTGAPLELTLPTDFAVPAVATERGGFVELALDSATHAALLTVARETHTTLFMLVQAALAGLLTRVGGGTDVLTGTVIAGRIDGALEDLVGMFVNTLVLRTDTKGNPSWRELIAQVRARALDAYTHADLPFERLVDALSPGRSLARHPLFQVMLVVEEASSRSWHLPGLSGIPVRVGGLAARFDLTFELHAHGTPSEPGGLRGGIVYRADLFTSSTARGLAWRLQRLLAAIAANPATRVGCVDLLTADERARLMTSGAAPDRQAQPAVPALIADRAASCPDTIAAEAAEAQLTYGALDRRARQLAAVLWRHGAGTDRVVAVAVPPSLDLLVALLGTWHAGAGYLPLETAWPDGRIAAVTGDARPVAVITTAALRARFADVIPVVPCVDIETVDWAREVPATGTHPVGDELAYVLYTSGSTGVPKGVAVGHRALATYVAWARTTYLAHVGRGAPVNTPVGFDATVTSMFLPLVAGRCVTLLPGDRPIEALAASLERRSGTTLVKVTPAHLEALPHALDTAASLSIGHIVVGGDVLPAEVAASWLARVPAAVLVNEYGPTEATVGCCIQCLDAGSAMTDPVPIGRPTPGTRLFVLDEYLAPLPPGCAGELYIGGSQLARGYVMRPSLTAERFIADPFAVAGGRLYRTGDRGKWRADGTLIFLGRIDRQIKLRGYRIELGEVEAALRGVGGVQDAVVVVRDGRSGQARLIAYVLPDGGVTLDAGSIRAAVAKRLPDYMVPTTVNLVRHLPTTANGKIDVDALPPDLGEHAAYRAPQSAAERELCRLTAELLRLPHVSADDNFFKLGGDSILSVQLVSRARAVGWLLSTRDVFEHGTIAGLAAAARPLGSESANVGEDLADAQLADLQRRLDVGEQVDAAAIRALVKEVQRLRTPPAAVAPDDGAIASVMPTPIMRDALERGTALDRFSQSVLIAVPAEADAASLVAALQAVVDHHDCLRLQVTRPADAPTLAILPRGTVHAAALFRAGDDPCRSDEERSAVVRDAARAACARLSPASAVMLQAAWFRAGNGLPPRLLLVGHHFAVDGVSWRILVSDLAEAWSARREGREARLSVRGTSFRRWSEMLHAEACRPERVRELEYWRDVASGIEPLGAGVLDRRRDTVDSARRLTLALPTQATRDLVISVPGRLHARLHEILLSALAMAIAAWRPDRVRGGVAIEVEGHGRDSLALGADVSTTVGWFTASYPVRLTLPLVAEVRDDASVLARVIKELKEQLRAVPDHGFGFGLLRHANPVTAAALAPLPRPPVAFNYLGRLASGAGDWEPVADANALLGEADPSLPLAHGLDVTAMTLDRADGPTLVAHWRWAPALWSDDSARGLADEWFSMLQRIVACATDPAFGGRTPSDVPLADVTQDEIDYLEHRYPGLDTILPLAPLQEGLLFHALYDAQADPYVTQLAIDLEGALSPAVVDVAAQSLVGRHPQLSAAFAHAGLRKPVAVISREVRVPCEYVDLSVRERGAQEPDARALRERVREERFDMSQAPLLRLHLIGLAPLRHRLILTAHHILLDGWSTAILLRELLTLCRGGVPASALPPAAPYDSYLAWLRRQDRQVADAAWSDALSGLAGGTLLASPTERAITRPAELVVSVPEEDSGSLLAAARRDGLTLSTLLQAAWAMVLARATGHDEVVFGATVAGRPPDVAGVEHMVGLFINTVPVRVRWRRGEALRAAVARLQREQAALLPYHHVPTADIQRLAHVGELFDTLLVFENYPIVKSDRSGGVGALTVTAVEGYDRSHYPLAVVVSPPPRFEVRFQYRIAAFTGPDIADLAVRFRCALTAVANHGDRTWSALDLLSDVERRQLVEEGSGPVLARDDITLPMLFAAAAARTPDAVAVTCRGEHLSYAALERRVNRLARLLVARGAMPEALVAVALPRSVELVAGLLAVWTSGAAYVPLDVSQPVARLQQVLDMAAPVAVIGITATTSVMHARDVLRLDDPGVAARLDRIPTHALSDAERRACLRPLHPAYVIFTSGSTGSPKGVVVQHASVVNLYRALRERIYDTQVEPLRVALNGTVAFDTSVKQLIQLFSGHTVAVVNDELRSDPVRLVEAIGQRRIDVLDCPPSLLRQLLDAGLPLAAGLPRALLVAGEAIDDVLWQRLAEGNATRSVNLYGPTECTVDVTTGDVQSGIGPALGRPLANVRVQVLDHSLGLSLPGAPGELYVGGAGLARGYLHRPALTAERFVADPIGPPGSRLYRTGDIVRRSLNGRLTFVGRADDQVKVRGFRIELGEIESALRTDTDVRDAAVVARRDTSGEVRLIAYVSGRGARDGAAIAERLAGRLPEYMRPSMVVVLDDLPLTANGKIDRRALPEPAAGTAPPRAPRTADERALCGIFEDVLGVAPLGVDDNFFERGGHSLLAAKVAARIRAAFGEDLPIRALFDAPTVATLAGRIGTGRRVPPCVRHPRQPAVPLSYGQQRLWFLHRLDPEQASYSVPFAVRLSGDLDRSALTRAVAAVVQRHEILRTLFRERDGVPWQEVQGSVSVPWSIVDGVDAETLPQLFADAISLPFDLTRELPLRAWLFGLEQREHVLLLVAHHIACDGWSAVPLWRDLALAYAAGMAGEEPRWAPLLVQYADYVLWEPAVLGAEQDSESELHRQLAFWRATLAHLPPSLAWPGDGDSTGIAGPGAGRVDLQIPAAVHGALLGLARRQRASPLMIVQAAVAALLTRLGFGSDVPLGTAVAGRSDRTLDDLVGFFVNTIVVRVDTAGNPTCLELLNRVRGRALDAYSHSMVPFERVVEAMNPPRSLARHPLFQVMVTVDPPPAPLPAFGSLSATRVPAGVAGVKFDMALELTEHRTGGAPAGLTGGLTFRAGLLPPESAAALADRFVRLLTTWVADPTLRLGSVDLLAPAERRHLLEEWNAPPAVPAAQTVTSMVAEQARRRPDAIASVCGDDHVTYAALVSLATDLACELRAHGVAAEDVVAAKLPRSNDLAVAQVAIWLAGGVYLPLDPEYPPERLRAMMVATSPALVLTTADASALSPSSTPVLDVRSWRERNRPAVRRTLPRLAADQAAYLIYTSGSAGAPKSVVISHRSLATTVADAAATFGLGASDVVAAIASPSFDVSLLESTAAWVAGATSRIIQRGELLDAGAVSRRLRDVTVVHAVPSLMRHLLTMFSDDHGRTVHRLWTGGDAVNRHLLSAMQALPGDRDLRVFYGPTEAAIICAAERIEALRPPPHLPIGRPLAATRLYVLDQWLQPVPPGFVGDLYVAGARLGRGYLQRPKLTAERFVADSFGAPGARMYRTGDRARWDQVGRLTFAGRADRQLKVRGVRVEPGEVEAVLRDHPGVSDAVVTAQTDPAGDVQLIAHVATTPRVDVAGSELRAHISARLPEPFVPAAVIVMDALPRTVNGKVDVAALPAPVLDTRRSPGRPPRTPIEIELCELFAQVLGTDGVGLDDDFFLLGGHSLAALRLVARIRAALDVDVPVQQLFNASTVEQLAALIALSRRTPAASAPASDGHLTVRYL